MLGIPSGHIKTIWYVVLNIPVSLLSIFSSSHSKINLNVLYQPPQQWSNKPNGPCGPGYASLAPVHGGHNYQPVWPPSKHQSMSSSEFKPHEVKTLVIFCYLLCWSSLLNRPSPLVKYYSQRTYVRTSNSLACADTAADGPNLTCYVHCCIVPFESKRGKTAMGM